MLCQNCKSKEANTHVKSVINGEYQEFMLCSECAKEMGYSTNIFADMHSDFNSILGSFFSNALPERSQTTRCKVCGSTYHDIAKSGQVGCANCYDLFIGELMPTIRRIHGNTTHCGKSPENNEVISAQSTDNNKEQIDELKTQLKEAIDVQNFEKAAELRDKIKEMEESK